MKKKTPPQSTAPLGYKTKYAVANNLSLVYEEFGDPKDPPILLIMGLGMQMISWRVEFCKGLAAQGFRVIRFDNRDIGLSEKISLSKPISIARTMFRQRLGLSLKVPYDLSDMAKDTVGLLAALGIDEAHIVGASMGGMIAQLVAAQHPQYCLSLTSIMSTTGNPALPSANWRVIKQLMSRPKVGGEAAVLKHGLKTWEMIGSPDYPTSQDELSVNILTSYRRSHYIAGYQNQIAAILKSGDLRKFLGNIAAPTLVIHGKSDLLASMEGGIDTAKHIKGADLTLIEGMGHDIPKQLWPRIIGMIAKNAKAAKSN